MKRTTRAVGIVVLGFTVLASTACGSKGGGGDNPPPPAGSTTCAWDDPNSKWDNCTWGP